MSEDVPEGLEPVVTGTGPAALTYYRGGSRGTPLVLLNALGQGLHPWSRLVQRLLPRRVLVWQLRGIEPPHAALSLAEHADDLATILAADGVGACHLVGWCTGPKLALRHYHRDPQSVRSMLFLNPAFKHPGRPAELDTPYERSLEALCRAVDRRPEAAGRLKDMFQPGAFGGAQAGGGMALDTAVRKPFASGPALIAYARQHLDFWALDATVDTAVDVPILAVAAEHDEIVSPHGVQVAARRFPTARYTEIAGAGHHALFEHADRVAGLIEGFVLHVEGLDQVV